MRRWLSLLAVIPFAAALAGSAPARAQSAESCIKAWPETRYGAMAYNHVVHVSNACEAEAVCQVSTDVNPEVQKVAVAGHSEVQVMTFIGSPARVFKPNVQCVMRK